MADTSHPNDRFSRIEQIYHKALERPESERPAFLAQACAGDSALRSEVEILLRFDGDARSFMESTALEVAAQALARNADLGQKINLVGQMLLHYRVLQKIGEGGMGIVYRALDTHLQRPVAIKVLPPEIVADLNRRLRFVQEASAASALNHPNIVHIYDIGRSEGTDFITMEYVESADGKAIFVTDANMGLWRVPIEGGESRQVLESLANFDAYKVTDDGIYFIPSPHATKGYSIRFLELATGEIRTIAELGKLGCRDLAIAPDRRWALYTQINQSGGDLMLVENFR
jgi:hypothetical protein